MALLRRAIPFEGNGNLTLDDARLHGTPTSIDEAGASFTVTFTASNERGSVDTEVNFRVADENAAAPSLAAFTMTTLTENSAYNQSITATGSPTPDITSLVTTGTLPTGLTLDGARLHGTPTGLTATVTFTITWTATNSAGVDSRAVNFTVNTA